MRYKLPRWVGVATLLITAMKLGIPAFAQEFEPGDQSIDPSVEVIETIDPSVEEVGEVVDETVVVDPGIEVVDPGVEVVDPGIEVVDPGVEVVDASGEGTGTGDECVNGPPGLYAADCTTLARGVVPYEPAYKLWSDDADKHRFIYLPPVDEANPDGPKQPINATNPDRWVFPPKTRLYKTFLKKDTDFKYETRIIQKDAAGKWSMTAYAWDREQKIARPVPGGEENVLDSQHDIPNSGACVRCHNSPERVLGFSAIQLRPGGGLLDLVNRGELIEWKTAADKANIEIARAEGDEALAAAEQTALDSYLLRATIQGDSTQTQAVGHLHANCGHCHNGPFPAGGMSLLSKVFTADPSSATERTAPNGITAICQKSAFISEPDDGKRYGFTIHPGNAADSSIIARMTMRDQGPDKFNQMPPLATEIPDSEGIAKVRNWINSFPDNNCRAETPQVEAPEAVF